jgi:hypothetical protein
MVDFFASPQSLKDSLNNLSSPTKVLVSYDSCASRSELPDLEKGIDYMAVLVLDNWTARQSNVFNGKTNVGYGSIDMKTPVRFFDIKVFGDHEYTKKLSDDFKACNPAEPCIPSGLSDSVSSDASIQLDKYYS